MKYLPIIAGVIAALAAIVLVASSFNIIDIRL